MLSVTGGVNTHKGAIWSLGLCSSVLASHQMNTSKRRFFQDIAKLASTEDRKASSQKPTHGQTVKQLHGLTGSKRRSSGRLPSYCLCFFADASSFSQERLFGRERQNQQPAGFDGFS